MVAGGNGKDTSVTLYLSQRHSWRLWFHHVPSASCISWCFDNHFGCRNLFLNGSISCVTRTATNYLAGKLRIQHKEPGTCLYLPGACDMLQAWWNGSTYHILSWFLYNPVVNIKRGTISFQWRTSTQCNISTRTDPSSLESLASSSEKFIRVSSKKNPGLGHTSARKPFYFR